MLPEKAAKVADQTIAALIAAGVDPDKAETARDAVHNVIDAQVALENLIGKLKGK